MKILKSISKPTRSHWSLARIRMVVFILAGSHVLKGLLMLPFVSLFLDSECRCVFFLALHYIYVRTEPRKTEVIILGTKKEKL